MKLVIDIPDKDYEFIKDLQSLIIGSRGNCRNIQYNVINAIKNGTPLPNQCDICKKYRCNGCQYYEPYMRGDV